MRTRFRFLAVLVGLLTLGTFFAQDAWASACPMGGTFAATEVGSVDGLSSLAGGCAVGAATSASDLSNTSHTPDPGPVDCPFVPAGAGGCGTVSLLATTGSPCEPITVDAATTALSSTRVHPLLFATGFFRPPKV